MKKVLTTLVIISSSIFAQDVILFVSGQTIDDVNGGTLDIYMQNTEDVYGFQFDMDTSGLAGTGVATFGAVSGGTAGVAGFLVQGSDSGTVLGFSLSAAFIPAGEGVLTQISWDGDVLGLTGPITIQITNIAGVGGSALTWEVGLPFFIGGGVLGCTDPNASNYNPEANYDDGSCEYEGCIDEYAINYNPDATISDGSCYYLSDINIHFQTVAPDFPLSPMGIYVYSAIIESTNLRVGDEIGIYEGESCIGVVQLQSEIESPIQFIISIDNIDTPEIDGYISGNPLQFRFWDASEEIEIINIENDIISGSDVYTPMGSASVNLFINLVYGCTNPEALNYDVDAVIDDGTCILPVYGCMIDDACNFNPEANIEDESCLFYDCMMECGGEAYNDDCGVCSGGTSNHLENSDQDCFGDCFGIAYYNECYYCVEGNTDLLANHGLDCDNVCDGQAFIDECGCVGGTTGYEPQYCFGCTDEYAVNYDETATYDDDTCLYPSIGDMTMDGVINVIDLVQLVEVVLDGYLYIDYMDLNQDGFLNIIDIVALVDIILHPEYLGCTDPNAPNYNPEAFYDDGSCDYSNTVVDIDGNTYETVQIGDQVWMAENLKVTHYNNGDPILTGYTDSEWSNLDITETGAFAVYNDYPSNAEIYGNLYNWYTVDDIRGVCPEDFHLPTDGEWTLLTDFLGESVGSQLAGNADLWNSGALVNDPVFGSSGFLALPGGYRSDTGHYNEMDQDGYIWSATAASNLNAWRRNLHYGSLEVSRGNTDQRHGFSVRCIQDDENTYGCTNPEAFNYNPEATIDDGSCEFENDTCTDYDGNTYETVQIGDQDWMAENLKVTHYRNGDEIPTGYNNSEWYDLNSGAYAVYDNDPYNAVVYGNLYNWFTIEDDRGLCIEGWHVPSDGEWLELVDYLGYPESAGGKLKEVGLDHWNSPNTGASNTTGFTALPGGVRTSWGEYYYLGNDGKFWTSTENSESSSKDRLIEHDSAGITSPDMVKEAGYSVRCVKDSQ